MEHSLQPKFGQAARELAGLLSLCADVPVAWFLLEELLESDFWQACRELVEAGWLSPLSRGAPLQLLQRQEARKFLRGASGRRLQKRFIAYFLEQCRRIPSLGGVRDSAYWVELVPHLEEMADHARQLL